MQLAALPKHTHHTTPSPLEGVVGHLVVAAEGAVALGHVGLCRWARRGGFGERRLCSAGEPARTAACKGPLGPAPPWLAPKPPRRTLGVDAVHGHHCGSGRQRHGAGGGWPPVGGGRGGCGGYRSSRCCRRRPAPPAAPAAHPTNGKVDHQAAGGGLGQGAGRVGRREEAAAVRTAALPQLAAAQPGWLTR